MHGDAGHEQAHDHASAPAAASQAEDPQATVVSLLLQAAAALARAGEADRACKIAASAWAALRDDPAGPGGQGDRRAARPRPPRPARARARRRIAANQTRPPPREDPDLDVRDLAPARRHETIFSAYLDLAPGAGFVLVNDHDPRPLRYQFEAEHAGQFTWEYLESGPEVWRVRIGRPAAAAGGEAGTDTPDAAAGRRRGSRTWTCGRSATRSGTG